VFAKQPRAVHADAYEMRGHADIIYVKAPRKEGREPPLFFGALECDINSAAAYHVALFTRDK